MKFKKIINAEGIVVEVVDSYKLKDGEQDVPVEAPVEAPEPVVEPVVEPETPPVTPPATPAESVGEVEAAAEEITKSVIAKLGLGKLTEKVETLSNDFTKRNSKLEKIFANTATKSDYDGLTTNEKVVAFYQAAVQCNHGVLKALSEGTAADGGYLFPDEFRYEVLRCIEGLGHMRNEVKVIPMKRDVMKIPTLESSVQVTWTEENTAKSTTTAHFGQATLTVYKMAAILYASDELIEDSSEIDIVKLIIDMFAEAVGREEDRVIAVGNGTTQPTGLVTARTAGNIASVACVGNLGFDDIINLEYLLPKEHHSGAKFYANRANIKELRKLKDTTGRYLWSDPIAPGQPATIHGYPFVEYNWLGEDIIFFGDLKKAYWLGDRKKMSVKVSQDTETAFTRDQTAIRIVERIAGNVVLACAVRALISIP